MQAVLQNEAVEALFRWQLNQACKIPVSFRALTMSSTSRGGEDGAALMTWAASHHAPRDRPVWLFLPCASFKAQANGTVTDVTHAAVVAQWDHARGAWISRTTGHEVYPSLWSDADVEGVMPDNPLLDA